MKKEIDDIINGIIHTTNLDNHSDRIIEADESKLVGEEYQYRSKLTTPSDLREKRAKLGQIRPVTEFDVMKDNLLGRHAERFNHELATMPRKEFMNYYMKAMAMVTPKYKPVEHVKEGGKSKRKLEVTYHESRESVGKEK